MVSAVTPRVGHIKPSGHVLQSESAKRPVPLLKVPDGHFTPALDPSIQYSPTGHLAPLSIVGPLVGAFVIEPARQ